MSVLRKAREHAPLTDLFKFGGWLVIFISLVHLMPSQTLSILHGTVVAMQKDKSRFIVVADSRSMHSGENSHTDDSCKVIALSESAFVFTTGLGSFRVGNGPLIDMRNVAKESVKDFDFQTSNELKLHDAANRIALALTNALQSIASNLSGNANLEDNNVAQAIFGGSTKDNQLIAYLIRVHFSSVSSELGYTVHRFPDDAELTVWGSKEKNAVPEFWANQTARAKEANARMQAEIAKNKSPDIDLIKLRSAVQVAIEWSENPHAVGGPLDILELRAGGKIRWIQRKKECT